MPLCSCRGSSRVNGRPREPAPTPDAHPRRGRAGHRLGAGSQVVRKALQELMHQPSPMRGQIYLAVPEASIMGLQTAYKPFCLPRVQIINSSNETIGELNVDAADEVGAAAVPYLRVVGHLVQLHAPPSKATNSW